MALTPHPSFKKLTINELFPLPMSAAFEASNDETEAFAYQTCNQVKPGAMVEQLVFRRLVCCYCVGRLLDDGSKCAICRGDLGDPAGPRGSTFLVVPAPFVASAKYSDKHCGESVDLNGARLHPNECRR